MQGEDILSLYFAYHDQHSPPRINSLQQVEAHHTRTIEEDQKIDHEHLLSNQSDKNILNYIIGAESKMSVEEMFRMRKVAANYVLQII